jgi:hypothetical protein
MTVRRDRPCVILGGMTQEFGRASPDAPSGEYSIADLTEMFSVGRATVYRVLERAGHDRAREAT